jgi:hypothetical protein
VELGIEGGADLVVAECHGNGLQFHLSIPKTSKQWNWKNSVPIPMSRSEYLHPNRM